MKPLSFWSLTLIFAHASTETHVFSSTTKKIIYPHTTGRWKGASETVIYLCGTAHVATRSCEEVQALIRAVHPDVVFLELCSQRLSILKPPSPNDVQNVTLRGTWAALRSGKVNIIGLLLTWTQSHQARRLKVQPGEEFRVALNEGSALGARVMLGDRPMQVTIRRLWESLSPWKKMRLVLSFIIDAIIFSPRKLRRFMDDSLDDGPLELMKEVERQGKHFPSLIETVIYERDRYMTARLKECAEVLRPQCIVAVVGAGHVHGIEADFHTAVDREALHRISTSVKGKEEYCMKAAEVTSSSIDCLMDFESATPPLPFERLRFDVGCLVVVRDHDELLHQAVVVRQWYREDDWPPDMPHLPYVVELDTGGWLGVPLDSEVLISPDPFAEVSPFAGALSAAAAAASVNGPPEATTTTQLDDRPSGTSAGFVIDAAA